MATSLPREHFAKQILSIFVFKFCCRAGEPLGNRNFFAEWFEVLQYGSEDFISGIEYAAEKGWVQAVDTGFRLTESGYIEA